MLPPVSRDCATLCDGSDSKEGVLSLLGCPNKRCKAAELETQTLIYLITSSSSSSIGTTTLSWVSACSTFVDHSQ
jgi:hypothetical protein